MFAPGTAFGQFLLNSHPGFDHYKGIGVLNPYNDSAVKKLVGSFCRKFYGTSNTRLLVLGINPGRKGGGLTGIPFTDPVALEECCGIPNSLKKEKEVSSTFIYEVVEAFGGPEVFYNKVLLSAVCPAGFIFQGKNFNYYDDAPLLKKLNSYLEESVKLQAGLGVSDRVVVSLGKENAAFLGQLNSRLGLFSRVEYLEHPRFIMQYRRSKVKDFVSKYMDVIGSVL